jgi:hypothetical protein
VVLAGLLHPCPDGVAAIGVSVSAQSHLLQAFGQH